MALEIDVEDSERLDGRDAEKRLPRGQMEGRLCS